MFLLSEIVDEIKKELGGGVSSDESKFDDLYVETKIAGARAVIISNYLVKGGIEWLNESWIQTVDLDYVDRDKECDVVKFECPSVITVDQHNDGFLYVGHVNGIKPFVRARRSFTTLSLHRVFKNSKNVMWDFKNLELGKQSLIIYNNPRLEKVQIRGIFNNPVEVPGFRKDKDWYPVDANVKKDLVEMVTLDLLRKTRVPPDYISDSVDKPTTK
jgi:hypothetical protein